MFRTAKSGLVWFGSEMSDQRGKERPGTTLGYSGSILLLVWLILSCLTLLCLPSFVHAVDLVTTGFLHVRYSTVLVMPIILTMVRDVQLFVAL